MEFCIKFFSVVGKWKLVQKGIWNAIIFLLFQKILLFILRRDIKWGFYNNWGQLEVLEDRALGSWFLTPEVFLTNFDRNFSKQCFSSTLERNFNEKNSLPPHIQKQTRISCMWITKRHQNCVIPFCHHMKNGSTDFHEFTCGEILTIRCIEFNHEKHKIASSKLNFRLKRVSLFHKIRFR